MSIETGMVVFRVFERFMDDEEIEWLKQNSSVKINDPEDGHWTFVFDENLIPKYEELFGVVENHSGEPVFNNGKLYKFFVVEIGTDGIPSQVVPFSNLQMKDAKALCDKIAQENDSKCSFEDVKRNRPYGCYFGSDSAGVWLVKE